MSESFRESRAPIPAGIRRRVLVEAGHRCAIPTCRYIEVDIHHIVPWAQSKTHDYDNLIALCSNCHRRADRGEIDRKSLRLYKVNLRFAHDKFSQLEMDILLELFSLVLPDNAIMWPPFMHRLLKRILDAGYILANKSQNGSVFIGGIQASPDFLTLTDAGRRFLEELGISEM